MFCLGEQASFQELDEGCAGLQVTFKKKNWYCTWLQAPAWRKNSHCNSLQPQFFASAGLWDRLQALFRWKNRP